MARVLAVGATMWGALVLGFITADWSLLLIFGPGYLITVGYCWRAFGRPSLKWCRVIWVLSILIQGTWLVAESFSHGLRDGLLGIVWWLGATAISVVALLIDPGHPAAGG